MDSTKPIKENGAAGEPGSIRQLSVPGGRLRIAGTVNDSIVDGEGYRYSIFTQGCPHECPGCH
ncbi:MAG: 4Fe-4S cluster-binding domain-containing protein, partial [Selenomonadaceae bacterium]|nr:4Fe-4S cluster-binding domain-containing protein [Selenomonadaceae bacterium]